MATTKAITTREGARFYGSGCVSKRQRLFSVTPGVEVIDALQSASDLLSATEDAIETAGMGEEPLEGNSAWLVQHAITSAKAVIDSVQRALSEAAGREKAEVSHG